MREKRMIVLKPAGEVQQHRGIEYERWKSSLING
jgi:putative hemolysin